MKYIFFLIITISPLFIGYSSPKKKEPKITFNDSAFIKLTVINCSDTTEFFYKTSALLPCGCVIKKVKITHDTIYYFSHKTTKPDLIDLELRKKFQTYVIPGDTLKIVANLDPKIDDEKAIKLDGVFEEIKNFFSSKYERLGYWSISDPLAKFYNITYPIEKVFSVSDSLFRSEMEFLNNYKITNKLPHWFYETMKADIDYGKVQMRPYLISFRKFFFKENIINPEKYYIFDQVNLYNPKAKLSYYYYQCVDIYLGEKHEQDLEGKHGVDRALPIFERSVPEAKKILKGEILEYYLAYKTSELFAASRNINEFEKVDSLYNCLQTQFTNNEILEIINDQKNYKANYFESIKDNPFTFTKNIPTDK